MKTAYAASALALALAASTALAQNVKITPVGSHPGELCANDRATIFEDPTGVRMLYDVGQTITGTDDARPGEIHLVLLSHVHGDHIGDQKLKALGAGTCSNSDRVSAGPNSMTAEIAAAKNAAIVMTSDMGTFIGAKIQNIRGGKPVTFCPQTAGVTNVPVATSCRSNTHLGGAFIAKAPNAAQGVEITVVYASHANNVPLALLSEAQRASLSPDGTSIVIGPATGYVIKFTNGLTAYLSGDTGIHSEIKTVVNEYHKANLAVLNLGPNAGTYISGAHAMNELVRPASVILTHPNEAVTEGGKLRPASRTAALIKLPVVNTSGATVQMFGRPGSTDAAAATGPRLTIPGSFLRIAADMKHPIAFGMPGEFSGMFNRGQVLESKDPDSINVAAYPEGNLLLSGMALGAEQLRGKSAVMEVKQGAGRVVLFGIRPELRLQTRGTYKLLLNTIYLSAAERD